MSLTLPPVPGWWHRTWPIAAVGVLSVAMWTGRIRNILGDDTITGAGLVIRLALAISFVAGGVVVLTGCWWGWRHRNWRKVSRREADGWRVGPGLPEWGVRAAMVLSGWTIGVWSVQGIGILVDPNHGTGFKLIHTVLMVGSLVVAGTAMWGTRRSWPVTPPVRDHLPAQHS